MPPPSGVGIGHFGRGGVWRGGRRRARGGTAGGRLAIRGIAPPPPTAIGQARNRVVGAHRVDRRIVHLHLPPDCAGCRSGLQTSVRKVTLQPTFDDAGIFALGDGHQAVHLHLLQFSAIVHDALELVGHRQEKQVGRAHAIHRGDEGHGNAAAELAGVSQVFHHVNQAEHRAQNADGGGIAARRFIHLGSLCVVMLDGADFLLEGGANFFRIGAVHQHLQPFFHERIGHRLDHGFEREQTVFARGVAPFQNLLDRLLRVAFGRQHHPGQHLERTNEHLERKLQHDGARGATHHDEKGRSLDDGADVPAFEHLPQQDGTERDHDADNGQNIHERFPVPVLLWRSTAARTAS